jgi:hypothetical protein
MSFTRSLIAAAGLCSYTWPQHSPLMAAPMFLVSGPELVIACARAGIIGLPAANAWQRGHLPGVDGPHPRRHPG